MTMPKIHILPEAGTMQVLLSDFICEPNERHCAGPQLAPGEYRGRFERWYALGGRSSKLDRIIIDGAAVPVRQLSTFFWRADGHFNWGACELQVPHHRHYHGTTPGGDYDCDGDRLPHYGYYDACEIRLIVLDVRDRPASRVNLDAVPVPEFLPPVVARR